MRTEERGCNWSVEENGRLGALQLIFFSKTINQRGLSMYKGEQCRGIITKFQ